VLTQFSKLHIALSVSGLGRLRQALKADARRDKVVGFLNGWRASRPSPERRRKNSLMRSQPFSERPRNSSSHRPRAGRL
jgi:hypothetical protein